MFLLWAAILLGVLILVHELGHFLVAKATGVKVLRFSIGFGPKLLQFRIGETEYRLAAIPFGGYVKMLGQESSESIPAGIHAVEADGPAWTAGFRSGDLLLAVNGQDVADWNSVRDVLAGVTGGEVEFLLDREGKTRTAKLPAEVAMTLRARMPEQSGRGGRLDMPEAGMAVADHQGELTNAFHQKPLWARFAVVFAGPAFSLLFPILIYFVYFIAVDSMTSSRVGQVLADTPAARAGLRAGDRIAAIDGEETPFWADMAAHIQAAGDRAITLRVDRDGEKLSIPITPEASTIRNPLGDDIRHGRIGITSSTIPPLVGVTSGDSPAHRAGIRLGDRILSVNGQKLDYIWQLEDQLSEIEVSGRAVTMEVERPAKKDGGKPETFQAKIVPTPRAEGGFLVGLASLDTFVGRVDEDTPAALAGIKTGDRLLRVDGREISAWMAVEQVLRQKMEKPIAFDIDRNGVALSFVVEQKKEVLKGEYQEEVTRYRFGAWPATPPDAWLEGERLPVENRLSFAVSGSVSTMIDITLLELRIFGKLLSGELPFKMVGGPIAIFDIAGKAAENGWRYYLWVMAMISINLGILNLLPVPVLDGGHLMFFTIEAVIRKPLNQRLKERATMVGFAMMMMLMALAVVNDLQRYWDVIFG